jgi:hypothetical protein
MIVGPLDTRGLPAIVVSQAHAKSGEPEKIQQPAQAQVASFIRIPLREHEYRPAPISRAWKKFGMNQIILRVRADDGAGEGQMSMVEAVVRRPGVREECV